MTPKPRAASNGLVQTQQCPANPISKKIPPLLLKANEATACTHKSAGNVRFRGAGSTGQCNTAWQLLLCGKGNDLSAVRVEEWVAQENHCRDEALGSSSTAINQIRVCHQSEDRKDARVDDPGIVSIACR
jgi:hypothetical protein